MGTNCTVADSESVLPRTGGWRLSLADLFRWTTVCGLAMLAVLHFGPLAAARDIGIALAIVLALGDCHRSCRKSWLAAGLVAAVGIVPTVLAAGAPFSDRDAVCVECGMRRHIHEACGWTTQDEIGETEASRWVAPLVPAGHTHGWAICTVYSRTRWFGSASIACGGPEVGAFMAWHMARLEGNAAGERAYREYQEILTGKSPKTMAVHRQEMRDALTAAARAKR